MTRAWCVVLVVAGALPAGAAPRTNGKVVRVERARASSEIPRICDVSTDKSGNCFGREPKLGDIILLVDESGIVGEARVAEVTPFGVGQRTGGMPNKGCDGLWTIKAELMRGDLGGSQGRTTMGVIDAGMHPRLGKMIPKDQLSAPGGRNDETPAFGFDRDGDKTPDIILTQSSCDGNGGVCLEEWLRVDGRMEMVNQVNFQNCGL